MMAALKAEFRKLLTVRSTFVMLGVSVLFVLFFAGYVQGWRLTSIELLNKDLFTNNITIALASLPTLFGAIVAILLVTHEYRYNTIMYTLAASRSRTKVLVAKLAVVTVTALFLAAFMGVLAPAATYLGVHLHGHVFVAQAINYHTVVWRGLFSVWSYMTIAFLLAVLVRNQIAAIVSLFAVPIVEQILSILLKNNSVYLPFTAHSAILSPEQLSTITYGKAAITVGIYLVVGWVVAWILFVKRDAN